MCTMQPSTLKINVLQNIFHHLVRGQEVDNDSLAIIFSFIHLSRYLFMDKIYIVSRKPKIYANNEMVCFTL